MLFMLQSFSVRPQAGSRAHDMAAITSDRDENNGIIGECVILCTCWNFSSSRNIAGTLQSKPVPMRDTAVSSIAGISPLFLSLNAGFPRRVDFVIPRPSSRDLNDVIFFFVRQQPFCLDGGRRLTTASGAFHALVTYFFRYLLFIIRKLEKRNSWPK